MGYVDKISKSIATSYRIQPYAVFSLPVQPQ